MGLCGLRQVPVFSGEIFFFFGDIQFVSNHGLASVMFLCLGGSHGGNGRHLGLLETFGPGRGSWPCGEWLVGGGGAPGRGKSVGQDGEAGSCGVSLENSQSFMQSEGGRKEGRLHRSAGANAAVPAGSLLRGRQESS